MKDQNVSEKGMWILLVILVIALLIAMSTGCVSTHDTEQCSCICLTDDCHAECSSDDETLEIVRPVIVKGGG